MIEIELKQGQIDKIVETLRDTPRGAEWSIRQSIKYALGKGRTEVDRAIRARYNVRQKTVLSAVSQPYVSGLFGTIRTLGSRVPLADFFGTHDDSPGGVEVEIIKGSSKHILGAFQHGNRQPVLERESSDRYPLATRFSISVAEMLREHKVIEPAVQNTIETALYSEMRRLMMMILAGHRPKGVG
jgi:hypothetical protein